MSCKHCSAIGGVESFLDDPSNWYSANEWSKLVQEDKDKEKDQTRKMHETENYDNSEWTRYG